MSSSVVKNVCEIELTILIQSSPHRTLVPAHRKGRNSGGVYSLWSLKNVSPGSYSLLLLKVSGSDDERGRVDAKHLCPATDNHNVESYSGSTSARTGY